MVVRRKKSVTVPVHGSLASKFTGKRHAARKNKRSSAVSSAGKAMILKKACVSYQFYANAQSLIKQLKNCDRPSHAPGKASRTRRRGILHG